MSKLSSLRNAKNIYDFATLLGYEAKTLAYIIYKTDPSIKYQSFDIPKKDGGKRRILAPNRKLKILQKALSELLYECVEEIKPEKERLKRLNEKSPTRQRSRKAIAHGFQQGLSIASNAEQHINSRYVFNIDLENFFPSINFGRVRGYFIKNVHFRLNEKIATIIAQIACHENQLPQGSPCSPVISNLIGQILDMRLVGLAKRSGCTYTRYADDLTFSTDLKKFPTIIARKKLFSRSNWMPGPELVLFINQAGFSIKTSKTRMQYKTARQEVTGIVVNKTVNVQKEYYRDARAMCNSLFRTGIFYFREVTKKEKKDLFTRGLEFLFNIFCQKKEVPQNENEKSEGSLEQLEGILNYIYYIKDYRNMFANRGYRQSKQTHTHTTQDRCNQYSDEIHLKAVDGIRNLYAKFLIFKNFHRLAKPLIYCEGKTDKIYLSCALYRLMDSYPNLIHKTDDGIAYDIKFFNYNRITADVMRIAEGTSGMKYLISAYQRLLKPFICPGRAFPVILLIDNDEGAKGIYSQLSQTMKEKVVIDGNKKFYHVVENLYVVPIPKINSSDTKIEDYFSKDLLGEKIDGKSFNPENTSSGNSNQYGKTIFAEKIVRPRRDKIDFSSFKPIFDSINSVISDYATKIST